jgi:hypothetical protein
MRNVRPSSARAFSLACLCAAVIASGVALLAGTPQATTAPAAKPAEAAKPAAAAAAPAGPQFLLAITDVKPESWDAYVALQKSEGIPALQKGGREMRRAWRTQGIGRAYEVAYIYPIKTWGELDGDPPIRKALGADGEKAYNAKLRPMVVSTRSFAVRLRSDLSYGLDSGSPKMGILAHVQIAPGKQAAYEGQIKSDWIPALKKANVGLYAVYEVLLGGNMGEYYTFTPIDTFAALDAGHPIMKGMTPAQYNLLASKMASSLTQVERSITKLDEDLSFGSPAQ